MSIYSRIVKKLQASLAIQISMNYCSRHESTKYLVLKVVGGLGNRIVSLQKAINYAKRTKRTLYVEMSNTTESGRIWRKH